MGHHSESSPLIDTPINQGGHHKDHHIEEDIHDPHFTRPNGTPWPQAVFSVVATMAGAGVLGMPSAVQQSGWIGIFILLVVWVMAKYTGQILIKCMYASDHKIKTYQAIGEAAFGKPGFYITLALQNLTLLFVGTLFLILAGSNLKALFDQYHLPHHPLSVSVYIAATTLLVLPFIIGLKTMKEISFIAIFGMLATTFAVVVIVIFAALDKISPSPAHKWVNVDSIPFAFVSFVFAFGGHNVFPTIQDTMKTPRHFDRMFNVAFVFILFLYVPPCIVGYWAFGDQTKGIILENLKTGVVPAIATVAITLHLFFTIPIVNNPVNLWLEEVTKISDSKYELLFRAISRTILIGCQTGIAVGLPFFGDVMGFIGSTCVSATVFFLPCWFYMKLYWHKIKVWEIIWIGVILLTATLGSVIGMYSACIQMYEDASKKKLNPSQDIFYGIVGGVTGLGFLIIVLSILIISKSARKHVH